MTERKHRQWEQQQSNDRQPHVAPRLRVIGVVGAAAAVRTVVEVSGEQLIHCSVRGLLSTTGNNAAALLLSCLERRTITKCRHCTCAFAAVAKFGEHNPLQQTDGCLHITDVCTKCTSSKQTHTYTTIDYACAACACDTHTNKNSQHVHTSTRLRARRWRERREARTAENVAHAGMMISIIGIIQRSAQQRGHHLP